MTDNPIADNIAKVATRIRTSASECDRDPAAIRLMAVSKTRPASAVRAAVEAGITDIGENYLQEALEKITELQDLPIQWHFIGPIQSNKTRPIAEHFDWVHSVDRLKLARRLNDQRPAELAPLNICLQVNISDESTKSGVSPQELPALAAEIEQMPRLRLRGLMAIPQATEDIDAQRAAFSELRELFQNLGYSDLDTLSMGMSGDMEAAIMEGSTMVRVGTDIFGPRN